MIHKLREERDAAEVRRTQTTAKLEQAHKEIERLEVIERQVHVYQKENWRMKQELLDLAAQCRELLAINTQLRTNEPIPDTRDGQSVIEAQDAQQVCLELYSWV